MSTDSQNLILQEIFINQREVAKKVDLLREYIIQHMEKEEQEIADIRVNVARLDTKVAAHGKQWGAIHTVITSAISAVLSALGIAHLLQK